LTRYDPAHVCVPTSSNSGRNPHPQLVIRVRVFCRMFDRTAHISLHLYSDFKELAPEEASGGGELVGSPPPVKGVLWRFPKCCNSFFRFSTDFFCFYVTLNVFNGLYKKCWVVFGKLAAWSPSSRPESGFISRELIHPQDKFMLHCARQMSGRPQHPAL